MDNEKTNQKSSDNYFICFKQSKGICMTRTQRSCYSNFRLGAWPSDVPRRIDRHIIGRHIIKNRWSTFLHHTNTQTHRGTRSRVHQFAQYCEVIAKAFIVNEWNVQTKVRSKENRYRSLQCNGLPGENGDYCKSTRHCLAGNTRSLTSSEMIFIVFRFVFSLPAPVVCEWPSVERHGVCSCCAFFIQMTC